MEEILTVSRLSAIIKRSLENNFDNIKLTAEVSAVKVHFSGHVYFSLKDESAVIDAICWKGNFQKNNKNLENGMKITCYGKVSSYPLQSKYQFIVEKFEEAGIGQLLKIIEERKSKLLLEGLFDAEKKKKIPKFPRIIGVVTSPTGAVIRDILHRINQRFPSNILLWPVLVQGTESSSQVTFAINKMNKLPIINRPDVIIVARGGGSFEDLMPFNEENVIRAVYNSKIPIISAVGHETDTTLIDYVSDLRAPTPTAAAEFAVQEKVQIKYKIDSLFSQIYIIINSIIKRQKLKLYSNKLLDIKTLLNEKMQLIDYISDRLYNSTFNIINKKKIKLSQIDVHKPVFKFNIQELFKEIEFSFFDKIKDYKNKLNLVNNDLESGSYVNILRKGFTLIETDKKKLITSSEDAQNYSNFIINFFDGKLYVHKDSKQTELF